MSSQCETQLSPLELSQISFGMYQYMHACTYLYNVCALRYYNSYTLAEPAVLDFGSAVVDSTIEKTIAIKNFSQKHISVRMEVRNAIWSLSLMIFF